VSERLTRAWARTAGCRVRSRAPPPRSSCVRRTPGWLRRPCVPGRLRRPSGATSGRTSGLQRGSTPADAHGPGSHHGVRETHDERGAAHATANTANLRSWPSPVSRSLTDVPPKGAGHHLVLLPQGRLVESTEDHFAQPRIDRHHIDPPRPRSVSFAPSSPLMLRLRKDGRGAPPRTAPASVERSIAHLKAVGFQASESSRSHRKTTSAVIGRRPKHVWLSGSAPPAPAPRRSGPTGPAKPTKTRTKPATGTRPPIWAWRRSTWAMRSAALELSSRKRVTSPALRSGRCSPLLPEGLVAAPRAAGAGVANDDEKDSDSPADQVDQSHFALLRRSYSALPSRSRSAVCTMTAFACPRVAFMTGRRGSRRPRPCRPRNQPRQPGWRRRTVSIAAPSAPASEIFSNPRAATIEDTPPASGELLGENLLGICARK